MKSWSLSGSSGFWCWSWPTSSFRKSSLPSAEAAFDGPLLGAPTICCTPLMVAMWSFPSLDLGEDVHQDAVGETDRGGDLGLVLVGGRERLARGSGRAPVTVCAGADLPFAGASDVELEQVQPLLVESVTELAGGLLQELGGLRRVGPDRGHQAGRARAQVHLHPAELGGVQGQPGPGHTVRGRQAQGGLDGL